MGATGDGLVAPIFGPSTMVVLEGGGDAAMEPLGEEKAVETLGEIGPVTVITSLEPAAAATAA